MFVDISLLPSALTTTPAALTAAAARAGGWTPLNSGRWRRQTYYSCDLCRIH
jgi:hypothetical protein